MAGFPPVRVECIYTTVCQPLPLPPTPHPPFYSATYNYYTSKKETDSEIVVLVNRKRLDGFMVAVMASSVVGQQI